MISSHSYVNLPTLGNVPKPDSMSHLSNSVSALDSPSSQARANA